MLMAKIEGDGIHFRATEKRWTTGAKQASNLRDQAERLLRDMEARRKTRETAAKRTARREKKEKAVDPGSMVSQLVPQAVQQHGDYRVVDFKLEETVGKDGKKKENSIRVVRNLAQTTVDRWSARGILDDRQRGGILFYQAAWRAHIGEPRIVANYDADIIRAMAGALELWTSSQMRAKEALRYLDVEVFFREPVEWIHVWQNVVIWDEPAGAAGGRIGYTHKGAEAAARVIVLNLAEKVASAVDDARPQEWSDLLAQLDLDAPRKPRGK